MHADALHHASQGFLWNNSQACVATSRTFVHEDIAPRFIEQMKERFIELKQGIGHPEDPKTFIGPLVDRIQFERVIDLIESGKREGELIVGGNRIGNKGYYVEPTIFLNPKNDARIYREEIFGPVLIIKTFKTDEEAIKLANDTTFGLSGKYIDTSRLGTERLTYMLACIFTSSIGRAILLSKNIKSGMVNINSAQTFGPDAPMGGVKDSGVGREGGRAGVMHYVEPKTIFIK